MKDVYGIISLLCEFLIGFAKEKCMDVSYNKFFKMLIDRKMKKKDICEQAGIATSTMAKMAKDENVSLDVLVRICRALNCTLDDILDILPAEKEQ